MAMPSSHFFMWLCLCASNLILAAATTTDIHDQETKVALFVFGDSLYDVGNNNYLNTTVGTFNHYPYGETFFKYPAGRNSDGRNIPDFITSYLDLPLIPPYLLPDYRRYTDGANFASGCAGVLPETHPCPNINLKGQLNYFKDVETKLIQSIGNKETRSFLAKALFMFSIGTNDLIVHFYKNTTLQPFTDREYVGMTIGNITTVIKEIYKSGGRRFGFLNAQPIGCTPLLKAQQNLTVGGCVKEINVLAEYYNKVLVKAFEKLAIQLKGFEYSIFDFYTTIDQRLQNPSKYGFKNGNASCCGSGLYRGELNCGKGRYDACKDPDDYLFFDGIHPTDKTNQQLAELMWSGSPAVSYPKNLKSLIQF